MARFYGSVKGSRGLATRLGGPASGLTTVAASWSGAVEVELYDHDGRDFVRVILKPWRGVGEHRTLYSGPVGGGAVAKIVAAAAAEAAFSHGIIPRE